MICYRVEHPQSQLGPYQVNAIDNNLEWAAECGRMRGCHSTDGYHRGPQDDEIGPIEGSWKCAFKSMRELEDWFEGWLKTLLIDYGFNIITLEVPDQYVKKGKRQICYDSNHIQKSYVIHYDFPE